MTEESCEANRINVRLEYFKLGPEYIKVVLWPLAVILLVIFFKDEVATIIKFREVAFAGVKIGQHVKDVNKNVQVELADIHQMIKELEATIKKNPGASEASRKIGKKIEVLSANLNKDISQLNTDQMGGATIADSRNEIGGTRTQAKLWEQKGFEFIIAKDVDKAIEAFSKSKANWPEYHNVAKIHQVLIERRPALIDSQASDYEQAWRKFAKLLLTDYSWGMTDNVRLRLRNL